MNRRRRLTVAIVAGQCLLMVGLIAQQEYRWRSWQTIQLEASPLDPEALFRGRYVELTYAFSTVKAGSDWRRGSPVWIRLTPSGDGPWTVAGVSVHPRANTGELLLRGSVRYAIGDDYATVTAGIESYFMSERKARETEQLSLTEHAIRAEIAVSDDGRAILKRLLVDGIPAEDFQPDR